eukprot:UN17821
MNEIRAIKSTLNTRVDLILKKEINENDLDHRSTMSRKREILENIQNKDMESYLYVAKTEIKMDELQIMQNVSKKKRNINDDIDELNDDDDSTCICIETSLRSIRKKKTNSLLRENLDYR